MKEKHQTKLDRLNFIPTYKSGYLIIGKYFWNGYQRVAKVNLEEVAAINTTYDYFLRLSEYERVELLKILLEISFQELEDY